MTITSDSERESHLRTRHEAQQRSNLNFGQKITIETETRAPITASIGQKCPVCKHRIRGLNHAEGSHHKKAC